MKLELLNYMSKKMEVEIGELNDIARIDIEVVTGDEIARVIYKDYSTDEFDSDTSGRMADYPDGGYTIYNITDGTNLLDDEKWKNRKGSYEYIWGD